MDKSNNLKLSTKSLINKTATETNKIVYSKSYIVLNSKKGSVSTTGGEAVKNLLKSLKLQNILE